MKSHALFLPLLFLTVILFAQQTETPWWYSLEQGKYLFRGGDYGNALLSFDDARRQRIAVYERMEQDFISLLSLNEVRRLGDSLEWVERYANERNYTAVLTALSELFYRCPKAGFNNSALAALDALGKLKNYPEAEYWTGEVYRAEGELALALSQYQKALAIRGIAENPKIRGEYKRLFEYKSDFESPSFDFDLLYRVAEIHKTRQEYNVMERTLLSIIAGDSLWSSSVAAETAVIPSKAVSGIAPSFARQAMNRTIENDGLEKFFTLYRYSNAQVEQAHRLLGFFYALSGRPSAQEHLMFAFLIQNSVIIEEASRRRFDFAFTGLAALEEEINRSPILADYAAKAEYYKTAYYLALSLYGNGKTAPARELWAFLAAAPQAGEWRNRAANQIRRPHTEHVVEMP